MKKIALTLILFVAFVSTSYGQGKYHEKQNNYYVEAAAEEFNLDKGQQKELSEFRMDMVKAYMSSNKDFKAGDITQDKKKELNTEASTTFHNKLSKLTGKTYPEMKDWLDEMREELKKVK